MRIGFQPAGVWQFWQGKFKFPCGLCVSYDCFCAVCGGPAENSRKAATKLMRMVVPKAPTADSFGIPAAKRERD